MATWVSNGAQTGGSGGYSPGTQSVNYILANFAANGDTITLPSGTFTWTTTTTITLAITLQGAGITGGLTGNNATAADFLTVITSGTSGLPAAIIAAVAPLSTGTPANITFSQIRFLWATGSGAGSGNHIITLDRSDVSGGALQTSTGTCIVVNCCLDTGTISQYVAYVTANGIIFSQCLLTTSVSANLVGVIQCECDKYGPILNWSTPDTMGGTATAFGVGDTTSGYAAVAGLNNTYLETTTTIGGALSIIDFDNNCRIVVRHCVLNDSSLHSHGGTSLGPARHVESYNNTFTLTSGNPYNLNEWVTVRSGTWLDNNNTYPTIPTKASLNLFLENLNRANYGAAFSLTGNLNSTAVVTGLSSTSSLVVNQQVTGTNIPPSTYIQSINSSTQITLTKSATATVSGATLFFLDAPGQLVYPASRQIAYGWSAAKQSATTTLSGNISGVNVTALSSTSALFTGQQVSGTGITAGTVIQSIVSGTAITLSIAGTTGTGVSLTFTGVPYGDPPALLGGSGNFGYTGTEGSFGYGQQLDPLYFWNNSGAGLPAQANTFINQYSTDGFTNNLTVTGTIYFNQQASNFSSASVSSLAATFPGSINGSALYGSWFNDLLLCMVSWTTSGTPTVSVTDASGTNTWAQIGSTFNASTGESQALFAAINKSATAAFAVTVHFSTAVAGVGMNIADYAGNWISVTQLQTPTTDGSNQNASSSSTTLAPGNITTTSQSGGNDLIIVWAKTAATPTGVSSGFNQQAFDATNHFGFFDNIGTGGSKGSFATTGTFGMTATTTAPWTASAVAFQSMPFLLSGRDFYIDNSTSPSGWTAFTYPHPYLSGGGGTTPGSGLTAAADSSITNNLIGVSSGAYSTPGNNYWALYSTQFTAQAKAGATEWNASSDTAYARIPMGASGAGWSVAAYSSGTGVVWSNLHTLVQPGVTAVQTLFSLGWCDALTGGNINFFVDSSTSVTVPVGIGVVLLVGGAAFTTY